MFLIFCFNLFDFLPLPVVDFYKMFIVNKKESKIAYQTLQLSP